jgi:trans-aconitate methyltransferase
MDYDATEIASTYDRGRDHGAEFLDLWMNVVSAHVKDQRIETILDLGCGPGRFSQGLAARFDAKVIGIDPSKKCWTRHEAKTLITEFDTRLAVANRFRPRTIRLT